MKNSGCFFARSEYKYLIDINTKKMIEEAAGNYLEDSIFKKQLICGLYFDTPDFLLIRRSIEKPKYKEKFRVRSYGIATEESKVYLEIKKKLNGITYKRRVGVVLKDLCKYFENIKKFRELGQIGCEIEYFFQIYYNLSPSIYISYEREAFFDKTNKDFRVTFDRNITWRDYDLSLDKNSYGEKIIDNDLCVMELKIPNAIPLWMTKILSKNKIRKTSFSKYGRAYISKIKGVKACA